MYFVFYAILIVVCVFFTGIKQTGAPTQKVAPKTKLLVFFLRLMLMIEIRYVLFSFTNFFKIV